MAVCIGSNHLARAAKDTSRVVSAPIMRNAGDVEDHRTKKHRSFGPRLPSQLLGPSMGAEGKSWRRRPSGRRPHPSSRIDCSSTLENWSEKHDEPTGDTSLTASSAHVARRKTTADLPHQKRLNTRAHDFPSPVQTLLA